MTLREKWIAALRSGKYKQVKNCLRDAEGGHCCLGVLWDVADPTLWTSDEAPHYDRNWLYAPVELLRKAGISVDQSHDLANMNDNGTHTFDDIADYLERQSTSK